MRRTIPGHWRAAVEDVPDRLWLVAGDDQYTYLEAHTRMRSAVAALRAAGVGLQDRVIVTARNNPEYLLTWLALMELGAVQVPLNPASTAMELSALVDQVDPRVVVTDRELWMAFDGRHRVDVVGLFDAPGDDCDPADVQPDDVAVMIPTSGTTGRSKLVMQTHRAYVMAGEGFPFWMRLTADDRLMTSLPLFHINAPAYTTLGSIAARASMVLLPAFSASTFLDSARQHGATEFNAIGAMLEILMRQPEHSDDSDNPLRRCYSAPSPTKERQEEIERRFGIEIVCGYGLSETPYGLMWALGTRPFGTMGSVRQHPQLGQVSEARVTDDSGREVGVGEVGQLELRNPAVMRGYYQMPEETAAVLVDGWLRTGDLVRDNGDATYTFVGRKKEIIRRRGENLSPAEVEAVLERHPDVAEAAVVAVPSDLSEDDVKAFVLPNANHTVDVGALHSFVAQHLARFKVPRYYEVVTELPHTPTGRLAKHELSRERMPTEVDTA
ncbi:MAG: AMP-dependent synthetase and ligase [Acidimicrobiales bacterium]|nr:AMP-dependent synthetase and ligase [Acidimicrobiales bacterium]